MSEKFTDGPWVVTSRLVGPLVVKAGDVEIAYVGAEDFATAQANAQLIAAAPDLYWHAVEAIKIIKKHLNDHPDRVNNAITLLESTLSRARGETET